MTKRHINPWHWQEAYGYAQAVETAVASRTLICAGQTANDEEGSPLLPGDMAGQIGLVLANIETLFAEAGWSPEKIVQARIFTTDMDLFMQHGNLVSDWYARVGCQPTQTLLGVSRLAFPEMLVEIEVTASQ